uniref:Lon proteolytic domain-containing protein n=1 Tax=Meloidogyne incognita TaxID=6306 RepID=A0A914NF94_MELIC
VLEEHLLEEELSVKSEETQSGSEVNEDTLTKVVVSQEKENFFVSQSKANLPGISDENLTRERLEEITNLDKSTSCATCKSESNITIFENVVSTELESSCNFGTDDGKLPEAIGRFTILCVAKSVKKTPGKSEEGNKTITKEFKTEGVFNYITVASSTSPNAGKDFLKGDDLVNDTKSRCVTVCENSAKEKGINFDWPNEKFSYEVEPEVKLTGDSLALSLIICIMSFVLKRLPPADLCCTGAVDGCGNFRRVGGLKYKLKAGADAGKSRILLPLAMKQEFENIEMEQRYGIVACYVINIKDLIELLFPPKKKD